MSAQPLIRRHRLSVEAYHHMGECGVLAPDARVEFVEGEIVDVAPIGSRHAAVVNALAAALIREVGSHAIVSIQNPIRLGASSEPRPDLAVLKPRVDRYVRSTPTSADTLLIIEVSESSAAYDLQVKAPLYAQHGVPELWIVDLEAGTVHQFRMPKGDRYREAQSSSTPGRVAVIRLDDVVIDLDAVLAGLLA